MKLVASIVKSFKENVRDWKVLLMVILFSPFFVLLMNLFYGGEPTVYKIGVLNYDTGSASSELIMNLESQNQESGKEVFHLVQVKNKKQLEEKVKEKLVDLGIVVPVDYSVRLLDHSTNKNQEAVKIDVLGSTGNVKYTVAAILVADAVYKQGMEVEKISLPSGINETFVEKKLPLNEFDSYVPGLISLAVLMILFTASASIVKENDNKTLIRLKLSQIGAFNFLAGISIVQIGIGVAAIVVSYWTAIFLGYNPVGEFGTVLVVGVIASFSMVAVSLIVSSFLNTVFDVLTIGCFPFFIMMFFSGSMFPLPKVELFSFAGHSCGITDILPLTHVANAFNKILNYGAGITDVLFEIVIIVVLTIIYFCLGLVLYKKRKLSRA